MAVNKADMDRMHEGVQTLLGERSRVNKPKQAVRVCDLKDILEIPEHPVSVQVGAAPTQAEHNALQSDVAKLYGVLYAVSSILKSKQ